MYFLLNMWIFHCYVSLPEGIYIYIHIHYYYFSHIWPNPVLLQVPQSLEKSPLCPYGQIRPIRLEISNEQKMSKDLQPVLCYVNAI